MTDGTGARARQVKIVPVRSSDQSYLDRAIELGNLAKKTMGLMPYEVYREAAAAADGPARASGSRLAVAVRGQDVVGYVMYRLSRRRVAIAHLCVDPSARRGGVARKLVEYVSVNHQDRLGIVAKCRRSFEIDGVWLHLGFTQRAETSGRGKDKAAIVNWWRDHGHPSLFTRDDEPVLQAAIDIGVLKAMVDESHVHFVEAQALVGDDLYQRLMIMVPPALRVDLVSVAGDDQRKRCTSRLNSFTDIAREDEASISPIRSELLGLLGDRGHLPLTWAEEALIDTLTSCIHAGVTVYTTFSPRDAFLERVTKRFGLRILRPYEVVVHIEDLSSAQDYRPAALAGSDYSKTDLRNDTVGLDEFANTEKGESASAFRGYLRELGQARIRRSMLSGPDGLPLVLAATAIRPTAFEVPLLRVRQSPEGPTLARQMFFALREECRRAGRELLVLTDPNPNDLVASAAVSEGFLLSVSGTYVALVIDVHGDAEDIGARAAKHLQTLVRADLATLRSGMPPSEAADVERAWWPAKLLDSDLETYAVSIESRWSAHLFGVPETLTSRPSELALSREHVYYRSPPLKVKAPARVLWYIKKEQSRPAIPAGIIGCSLVDASYVDSVDSLVETYRHLGVWEREQIDSVAKQGLAQVIRFTNTEIFPRQVPLARLQELEQQFSETIVPQSPVKISPKIVQQILLEGQARTR